MQIDTHDVNTIVFISATASKRSRGDVFRRETVLSLCSVCNVVSVQISLNWNYSHSFLGRPFIFSGIVDLPKAQKIVEPDFLFWAPFAI